MDHLTDKQKDEAYKLLWEQLMQAAENGSVPAIVKGLSMLGKNNPVGRPPKDKGLTEEQQLRVDMEYQRDIERLQSAYEVTSNASNSELDKQYDLKNNRIN